MGNRQGKAKTLDEELGNPTSSMEKNPNKTDQNLQHSPPTDQRENQSNPSQEKSVENDKHLSTEEKNRNQDSKDKIHSSPPTEHSKPQKATTSSRQHDSSPDSDISHLGSCSSIMSSVSSASNASLNPDRSRRRGDSEPVQKSKSGNLLEFAPFKVEEYVQKTFEDPKVRNPFIRKVYLVLTVQLLCTCGIIAFFEFEPRVKYFVQRYHYVFWISVPVFLVTLISIACCSELRRRFPYNYILLAVFTLALSYMLGALSSTYDTKTILYSFAISTGLCFLISLLSFYAKFDLTTCGGILTIALVLLIIMAFVAVFTEDDNVPFIYASIGSVLFLMYLIVDTQRTIGGKEIAISPEEYIFAALSLYIDIINIYLFILLLFGILANK